MQEDLNKMAKIVFELKSKEDKFLEKSYRKAMKELNEFFGINWKRNLPRILILNSRKEIDTFKGYKTKEWFIGEAGGKNIFLLDRKNFEKESSHKYSNERYFQLIKHELGHLYFSILSEGKEKPYWLNEGIAIYLSGQLSQRKKPRKFNIFMKFYSILNKEIYKESGFVVELLVKRFGKGKILKLIKLLRSVKSEKDFKKQFKKIYGFNLNYKEINKLWQK